MPRKHLQGDPEVQPDERLISGATLSHKIVFPLCYFVFCLVMTACWLAYPRKGVEWWVLGGFVILSFGTITHELFTNQWPLKEVWMGDDGILISNFEVAVRVPFHAVASVTQLRRQQRYGRYVVVTLNQDTPFGRRFTFVPAGSQDQGWSWQVEEDGVVIDLQERVENAHRRHSFKKISEPTGGPKRSIMADDELDGPI